MDTVIDTALYPLRLARRDTRGGGYAGIKPGKLMEYENCPHDFALASKR